MSEITSIRPADLRAIENNLSTIYKNMDVLNGNIDNVGNSVQVVYKELEHLAQDFYSFVQQQKLSNRCQIAETRLVKIRQELKDKFGHYAAVRRTTTGILQADDLGIVKKETISNVTEELMLSTPNYWLTPCLVALAAWINDNSELAEKALNEGIRRNKEKTSLLFALICRRAGRKIASLRWVQKYLESQDEELLDRKCVVILDAFASGLLGADSEGVISKQMTKWLEHLAEKPGFIEQQAKQWSDAINAKRISVNYSDYPYLRKYSKTWANISDVLEGAYLHAEILNYFHDIFEREISNESLKEQLDEILTNLVTEFDDEELPLRKEEKLEELVLKFQGDEQHAKSNMQVEETAFETHKDFTQLLTDAAMKPESSHASPSTQKFAIALSRDWISNAYNDIVAQNRMCIPHAIKIKVDSFEAETVDGSNENELINEYTKKVEDEKEIVLNNIHLTSFENFCFPGGIAVLIIGIAMMVVGSWFLGMIGVIAGIGMILKYKSSKEQIEKSRNEVCESYAETLKKGTIIIRATLAEVVDFRTEFKEKDSESEKVLSFLDEITPDQYVKRLSESPRKIKVS